MLTKEQAAKRLIHAAIRACINREDPVSVHLLLMASFDVLREYAEVKKITIKFDMMDNVRPTYRKSVVNKIKAGYYFLKHSRKDAGQTFDDNRLVEINDFLIYYNTRMLADIFGYQTNHMKIYGGYWIVAYPNMLSDESKKYLQDTLAYKQLGNLSQAEHLQSLRDAFSLTPEIKQEWEADMSAARK